MQPFNTQHVNTAGEQDIEYNPDGTVASITKVFPGGYVFVKTFTYIEMKVTHITDWELQ